MASDNVGIEVLPHLRAGERVRPPDDACASVAYQYRLAWAANLVLIALLGGRRVAMPYCAGIYLRPLGTARAGRVRYVCEDGRIALHFGGDPLNTVSEHWADSCLPCRPGDRRAVEAIQDLLATGPEPVADLDAAEESA